MVAKGKYETEHFSDKLIGACVEMISHWNPDPAPEWITCIPSHNHPTLVPDFAERLAAALGIPFMACVEKVKGNKQQREMENSYQHVKNLDGVFHVIRRVWCLLLSPWEIQRG